MKQNIILATSSPYRREAFKHLDLEFTAESSNTEEQFEGRPDNPEELTLLLAKLKAESVAKNHSKGIIIGFDSVGWFNNTILEKTKSREEALNRLKSLSGKPHQFFTGLHMINLDTGKTLSKSVKTDVFMRDLTHSEINKYLDQDPEFTRKATGFDPNGFYSSTFIKEIRGSYHNVTLGIPLEAISEMLHEVGYKI